MPVLTRTTLVWDAAPSAGRPCALNKAAASVNGVSGNVKDNGTFSTPSLMIEIWIAPT